MLIVFVHNNCTSGKQSSSNFLDIRTMKAEMSILRILKTLSLMCLIHFFFFFLSVLFLSSFFWVEVWCLYMCKNIFGSVLFVDTLNKNRNDDKVLNAVQIKVIKIPVKLNAKINESLTPINHQHPCFGKSSQCQITEELFFA